MSENDNITTTQDPAPAGETKAPRKRTPRKKAAPAAMEPDAGAPVAQPATDATAGPPARTPRKRTARKAVADVPAADAPAAADVSPGGETAAPAKRVRKAPPALMFQPPAPAAQPRAAAVPADELALDGDEPAAPRKRTRAPRIVVADEVVAPRESTPTGDAGAGDDEDEASKSRRRRRGRRGRGRREEGAEGTDGAQTGSEEAPTGDAAADGPADDSEEARSSRRRRRRKRGGGGEDGSSDDPPRTVTRVREPREPREPRERSDEVRGLSGSTRLEAKKIRRREGREQSRRRPPVITESEFLARREAVERVMLVQQYADRTQIAVLEDGVLVEHYVTKAESTSFAGNVYLGRVQNVLPSMEAAFVDIGKGRNAVLYAGEVNYDTSALEGRAPRIEQALKSGQEIVVQVTKDPIGQKGSRLTSQVSLPGRYMVYVPEGSMTGISRKLPDTERTRLKQILKTLKPEGAGIIVRTAAEGASEEDLTADLDRLKAQWDVIEKKAKKEKAPALLHGEPDLVIRVIRDNFNEDFSKLVVSGSSDYDTIHEYLEYLAPDLMPRLEKWVEPTPLFDHHRVNEQLLKAMDRKVWLPSGGSLVIDRTEAMTVVDVNTGKFVGKGGNLEETVTKNNLEAAEEIVRQLRLRDVGGIIVVDFIDMVLESNRELVMRRLKECLGRDRTKHQVAEVTSLGLVQMTRKRISQGLIEAFSETCEHCNGRGIKVHVEMLGGTPGATTTQPPQRESARREPLKRDRGAKQAPKKSIADVAAASLGNGAVHPKGSVPSPALVAAAAGGSPAKAPGAALAARAAAITDTEDEWAWAAGPVEPDPAAAGPEAAPVGADPVVPVDEAAAADLDGVPGVTAETSRPAGRRRGSRGRGRSKADAAAESSDAPASA
ncbi:MAG: ribonuclease [Frankiaceae bacterium]|nr:ribonuclease [Frankiaceae bacterium]